MRSFEGAICGTTQHLCSFSERLNVEQSGLHEDLHKRADETGRIRDASEDSEVQSEYSEHF